MKAYAVLEAQLLLFLTSALNLSDQLHNLSASTSTQAHRWLLTRRLCRHQSLSGRFGDDKSIQHLPGIEPRFLDCPASSAVTVTSKYPENVRVY